MKPRFDDGRSPRREAGISLVEALVAMAIMGFGMLGLVGLQSTLRSNSDISKQRSEAVRQAQQLIEANRQYSRLETPVPPVPGVRAFAAIGPEAAASSVPAFANTEYTSSSTVTTLPAPGQEDWLAPMKRVAATVTWNDRTDTTQRVEMATMIGGVAPELSLSLSVPGVGSAVQAPQMGHHAIPPLARRLPDGRIIFKPPQAPGGTVLWVFNNLTGTFKVCTILGSLETSTVGVADISSACIAAPYDMQLLSGYIRFASLSATTMPLLEAQAEMPTGPSKNLDVELSWSRGGNAQPTITCFDDSTSDAAAAEVRSTVTYYCAVPKGTSGLWAGRSRIRALQFVPTPVTPFTLNADPSSFTPGAYVVCRYSKLLNDGIATSQNIDHPLNYTEAGSAANAALVQQNFLVVQIPNPVPTGFDCPKPTPTEFLNARTMMHQRSNGGTYDNP